MIGLYIVFLSSKLKVYQGMRMNKLFLSVLAPLFLASCASEYQIEGSSSVSRLDGKMLFVKMPKSDGMVKVDSAEIIHGLFTMKGEIDSTYIASLYMDEESIMPFVMEQGNIRIKIENTNISVVGTPLNDRLNDFIVKKNSLDDRAYELERLESRLIMDGVSQQEIDEQMNEERNKLSDEMNALAKSFIQSNYENVLGPGVFILLCNSFPYPMLTPVVEEIVNEAPECFQNNMMVTEYMQVARENMKKIEASEY